jgi:hypothetical protein
VKDGADEAADNRKADEDDDDDDDDDLNDSHDESELNTAGEDYDSNLSDIGFRCTTSSSVQFKFLWFQFWVKYNGNLEHLSVLLSTIDPFIHPSPSS